MRTVPAAIVAEQEYQDDDPDTIAITAGIPAAIAAAGEEKYEQYDPCPGIIVEARH